MSRGRLIFPFIAEIAQIDYDTTAADPDGIGPLTSGYDDDFKEPVVLSDGSIARVETFVRLPCQVMPKTNEMINMGLSGDSPQNEITLVFHFKDLEKASMIDSTTGLPDIRLNDRLNAIYDRNGKLVQTFDDLTYVLHSKPDAFGLGYSRNLLKVLFKCRDTTLTKEAH